MEKNFCLMVAVSAGAKAKKQVKPLSFDGANSKAMPIPHRDIRHGPRDRYTSFPVPVTLATKLQTPIEPPSMNASTGLNQYRCKPNENGPAGFRHINQ